MQRFLAARFVCARSVVFCQNFWQITQRLPGNWRGGGKRFSGAFRAGAPSPLACLLLAGPCFLVPTNSKRLLRRLLRVAGEYSRLFSTPPLVAPRNNVWETSLGIPNWWRVTTQIWEVLLIGWSKFTTSHDQWGGILKLETMPVNNEGRSLD